MEGEGRDRGIVVPGVELPSCEGLGIGLRAGRAAAGGCGERAPALRRRRVPVLEAPPGAVRGVAGRRRRRLPWREVPYHAL